MKNLKHYTNKILAVLLLIALTMACLPLSMVGQVAAAGTNPYYNRVVDANTMDLWKEYFDLEDLTTVNAGGVWTDKSVFKDPTGIFPQSVTMLDSDENFLTALSVLGANKEIMGYSTIPTDTVLVLDLSNSMQNSGDHDDLVDAANDTIEALLNINRNNRVGVVLYSGNSSTGSSTYSQGVTRILPMGRYTVDTNRESEKNNYLVLNGAWVSLNEDLLDANGNEVNSSARKEFEGGTYIQAGLWEAMKMFEEQDTVIEDDNWQGGKDRMPIMVLMTDGGPSTATTYYDNVENSEYSYTVQSGGRPGRPGTTTTVTEKGSNVGTGNTGSITTGSVFLTQLTASYTMARIQNHYGTDVDGLFYTLGFNVGNDATATSVLDPTRSTLTDSLWNTYMQLSDQATMGFSVRNWQGSSTTASISRNPYVSGEDYVDRYFSAESGGLSDVFEDLVEEIILQSKYYPTHLQGGSADFSGYVTFEDVIGSFMEVKDIKGILLGDRLYSGQMMAALLDDPDGFGTGTNPTEYGNEFVRSVKTRLNIETSDAQNLIRNAYEEGQLSYVTDSNGNMLSYSNYVGWYAKADMTYISPWDDKTTTPSDAVYQVKSYVYLGEETGNQKDSDMMYMTVQLRTRIDTGEQSIVWKVPASLVPMVTYLVSLEGDNIDEAENVSVTIEDVENVSPIRLLFESGLKSNWNELNVHTITDSRNVADDGVSRRFWTNYFDISGTQHELHKTATAQFMPSEENERFYYTSDSVIYKKTLTGYTKVTEEDGLALDGEYYHRRYIFTEDSNVPIFEYEKLSVDSIEIAIENGWQADYTFADNSKGAYIVPAGTVTKELEMYSKDKKENETDSAHMIFYPYINYENGKSYVRMNLGNNGLLTVTPAQGISLTKTVDRPVVGSTGEFSFRLTAKDAEGNLLTGSYSYWITEKGVVPTEGKPATAVLSDGTFVFSLKADETIWMIGLPTDATWTIAEITPNSSYKVSSVHVDGISTGTLATGKVTAYELADVQFVNTPLTDGNLLINKNVLDENGNDVAINSNVKYEIEVTLANNALPVAGEYTMNTSSGSEVITVGSDGKFSVSLADGETVEILDLPEKTTWTAVEKNVPVGFSFDANASTMSGSISADDTSVAYVINRYEPTSVGGDDISVLVKKTISGNRTTWMPGEAYTFVINRLNPLTRAAATEIFRATINGDTPDHTFTYSLENEEFTAPGTYYYQIMELEGPSGNGVTYDTAVREFSVVVADSDMDGDLEIVSVNNVVLTTVEDNVVSADFENVYQPIGLPGLTIPVQKEMIGNYTLAGFRFGLYTDPECATTPIATSTLTGADGKANFHLTFEAGIATMEGVVRTYYIAEINDGIYNMTYDDAVYKLDVTIKDNGDGTVSVTSEIHGIEAGKTVATFTNEYVPSEEANVIITGKKTMSENRVQAPGEFTFELVDAAGNVVDTATNGADGSFRFDALVFTEEDVTAAGEKIVYTVREKQGDIGGIEYDDTVYTVEITVTDNGNSQIIADVVYKNEAASVSDISFHNVYDPVDTEVQFVAEKILTGKTLQDGEFTFVLKDAQGNVLQQKTNVGSLVTFDKIVYDAAGTFVYTIEEVPFDNSRYGFDTSVYRVTVVVTDNAVGTLTHRVSMTKNNMPSSGEIVFNNGFTPDPLPYRIEGHKELVADLRELEAGEFTFVLVNVLNGRELGRVTNDVNGDFSFDINLPDSGDYHLRVSEVVGSEKGITYDNSKYDIHLTVAKAADGSLSIVNGSERISKNDVTVNAIEFENSYTPDPANWKIVGEKKLTGGKELKDGMFRFVLKDEDGDVLETVSNLGGSFAFTDLTFDVAGEYKYTVSEEAGSDSHVTYSEVVYEVTVTVEDVDGVLKASAVVKNAAKIVFENIWTPDEIDVSLPVGEKELTGGKNLTDGMFDFVLKEADGDVIETVSNKGGKITFSDLTFDTAGEYKYTIAEIEGDDGHITYSEAVYEVTVTITNEDGVLKADVQVKDDADIAFENIWTPDEIQVSLPVGEKELTGGKNLTDGMFDFVLKNADGDEIETVTNKDGKITFSDLTFDTAGEYKYTISEVKGDDDHINYSETVYEVTVTITNEDGVLKADVQVKDDAEIIFENGWTPDKIFVSLPVGEKELTGGKNLADGMFDFVLKDVNGDVIETVSNKDGKITFDELSFDTAGEYKYTIAEIEGDDDHITYSEAVYEVTVTVTNEDGILKADVQVKDDAEIIFENVWTPDFIAVSLPVGEKELTGGKNLADGMFDFLLKDINGDVVEIVSNKDGKITFDELLFDTAGEYKYTISEEKGDDDHITYSEAVYEVTVTVTNEDGVLKADVQVKEDADITFENVWTPDEIQVSLPVGEKELIGGKNLEDGIFTFALRNAGGIVLETVFNKDGKITFSDLTFDTAGEYKYTITEEKGDDEHINYDETVYEVTVTVTNEDGVLKADVQVKDDAEITFENVWTPDQIHVNLPVGTKVLDGTKKLEDDMFRFVLKDASGKEIETVTNKAGRVTFDELSFETIGEYKYTVSEVKGDDKSVTYDETVYEVTVTITNENGVLKADVQIKDAEEILFINIWTPEKIFVSLPVGEKKLVGRDLADGEFEFVLMQDGKEIDRVANKDGKIVFDDLGFTEVGEYVYTISEVTGDAENVTYSDAVYEVTITITDENGLLVSKVAADEILFINQYEEPVENPDTGVGTAVGLWAALFLVSGGGLIVGARKKKEEDAE